ncbi:hypothetical protein HELRODRAFT_160924 [Helobdella robusta]|uniref:Uncharacterized protein n=1 Tax=Helobdella robusta TaxID=6412 RepID=T1EQV0_HELRO|nr:hypothetical protein HELRODRAFT_160924 [Helobdella robusta]ESO06726.1 hypothetical protein HELRODRAFT_160924 [Helobdella robusta]
MGLVNEYAAALFPFLPAFLVCVCMCLCLCMWTRTSSNYKVLPCSLQSGVANQPSLIHMTTKWWGWAMLAGEGERPITSTLKLVFCWFLGEDVRQFRKQPTKDKVKL